MDFNHRAKEYININENLLFTEIIEKENKENKYLDFILKNDIGKEIILSTENDEYSVFCSTYHCHFTPYAKEDEIEELRRAIVFLKEIIHEKLVIVTYYVGEKVSWGTCIKSTENPEIVKGKHIVLESWNNTYSRQLDG